MILLTGETRSKKLVADMKELGMGRVWTVRRPSPFEGEPWVLDNGAYSFFLIESFDGIFLGGTDSFKATAKTWCELAHDNGKLFHYARASTPKKIDEAFRVEADSLDSAFPLWKAERWDYFKSYATRQAPLQGSLFA